MNAFVKKTLLWAALGFGLGLLVGLSFLIPHGVREYCLRHGPWGLARHLLVSGLLGAVNMGSTTIYSLERWGVLRCTLIHFCITMCMLCGVGFSMDWFSLGDPVTLWLLASCVVLYSIIWLVNYLIFKRQIRQINEALKGWKARQINEALKGWKARQGDV